MLAPDRLKPLLVHEDRYIRRAAVDYFADGWSRDPDLIPLILDACERFGDDENLDGLSACHGLQPSAHALDRLLGHLARAEHEAAIHHLGRAIVHAPLDLLAARQPEILAHPKLLPVFIPPIRLRSDLAGRSGEGLWDELQDYARRSSDALDTGGIDLDYVEGLVDALACHNVPDEETICRLLRSLEPEEGWLEIFLIDLAGARRLSRAVPALVDKFRIDADYLLERSRVALARIGDPEAVHLIRAAYPTVSEDFRYYLAGALGEIKRDESEEAILALLEDEEDTSLRTILCLGLCDLFSGRGVQVVRDEIASGYDTWIASLEEHLLPVVEVLGVDLPEAEEWARRRAERESRMAARLAELDVLDRRLIASEASGLDPFAGPGASGAGLVGPASNSSGQIRRAGQRVGRNDPCPCGSGKKFKKCCGGASG